jgi:antitoxin VapB
MADPRAKIFQNGGSQAVRLPKSCRFPDGQDEVIVRRVGKRIVLEPADAWSDIFRSTLGGWHEEIEKPRRRTLANKKNPFDS